MTSVVAGAMVVVLMASVVVSALVVVVADVVVEEEEEEKEREREKENGADLEVPAEGTIICHKSADDDDKDDSPADDPAADESTTLSKDGIDYMDFSLHELRLFLRVADISCDNDLDAVYEKYEKRRIELKNMLVELGEDPESLSGLFPCPHTLVVAGVVAGATAKICTRSNQPYPPSNACRGEKAWLAASLTAVFGVCQRAAASTRLGRIRN
eukprot:m.177340 g.177340  ORF g.177340 m.177340 type:complete len:213 (-) comp10435_c8_seq9:55-693(-)